MQNNVNKPPEAEDYLKNIDLQVEQFEHTERSRLNLQDKDTEHWFDAVPNTFTAAQRAHTTILHAGLTMAHDFFIQSTFRGLGYKVEAMEVPDNKSLQFGREFGNRGQCNPTYFTVGNLVKKLSALKEQGLSKEEIIEKYIFATAGSCGPCRFGTYVTEYRKALRDAGFEGFRVLLFQQAGGVKQATGDEMGLKFDTQFFISISKAIILGDVLNALMYRIRPFEKDKGETNKVIARAKARIAKAMETRKGLTMALWRTRRELAAIAVDKTQIKPRVAIIGEFWAMTTEGDGNYKMHKFLEQEGAEVDIQLVTNWALYLLWGAQYDTRERAKLKGTDARLSKENSKGSKFALQGINIRKKMLSLKIAESFLRGLFYFYAKMLGLRDFQLPDMDHIAEISHNFYDNNLRGGEGHMEVGKLIHNVVHQKVNMTLSIKPFGCMPSSAVSDGVQSLITELYPAAIFLPIETNGDGAVNVYSRVQMQLFKAKQAAEQEYKNTLNELDIDDKTLSRLVNRSRKLQAATHRSPHKGACTAVDFAHEVAQGKYSLRSRLLSLFKRPGLARKQDKLHSLKAVKKALVHLKKDKPRDMVVKFVEP